jgi:hypothetical protein
MSTTERGLAGPHAGPTWDFEEREPWERGFAAYYRDWIAPELERWQEARRDQERRFRRRLPLLLGAWLVLTLLVAEASGSLAITLTWAILLLIIGGSMARGPIQGVRSRALTAVRDRVMGFFGLRPLHSGKVLESALRAQRLPGGPPPPGLGEQFWGVNEGIGLRLARLQTHPAGRLLDPSVGDIGLILRIEAPDPQIQACSGRWPNPRQEARPPGDPADALSPGLQALSQALGGAALDYARDRDQILIRAHGPLGALDWSRRVESWDPVSEAEQLETAIRALLRSVHAVLGAARLLAHPHFEKL